MYGKADFAAEFITKTASQVIWAFLITINFLTLFRLMLLETNAPYNADIIFVLSLINYILSHILAYLINRNKKKYPKIIILVPILASFISLFTCIYVMEDFPNHIRVGLFFYYLILWKKGVDFSVDEIDISTYKKGFWVSFVIVFSWFIFLILLMGIRQNFFYKWLFMRYIPIYLIISLITMFRLTFVDAYDNRFKNTINSEKNVFKVNIASLIIVLFALTLILTNYLGTGVHGVNFIYLVIKKIIDIAILGFSYIVIAIDGIFKRIIGINFFTLFMIIISFVVKFINFVTKYGRDSNPQKVKISDEMAESIANIGRNVAFAIVFTVIILLIIYRLMKAIEIKKRQIIIDGESKEFVIREEISNRLLVNRFRNMIGKGNRLYRRRNNFKDLPIIRQLYIKAVMKAGNSGYIFKKQYTPNEFLSKGLKGSDFEGEGFNKLTEYYNKVRYGGEELEDKVIEEAILIESTLDKK
ncbi:hypothetical protein [Sporosalibacterium faouarense]|uniref:hypothetical protein n=1 Tax=Sporosalibacterium faouarense TaxID=516123 RepID=UPI00141CDF04|nr:hypothetical protein [Sporosalibacterium faouarense]MTI47407.1 hypothetical protein [Bacillota bacterium]